MCECESESGTSTRRPFITVPSFERMGYERKREEGRERGRHKMDISNLGGGLAFDFIIRMIANAGRRKGMGNCWKRALVQKHK